MKIDRLLPATIGLLFLAASGARADTLKACEQSLEYSLAKPAAQVPAAFQGFSGVWVGKWDSGLCGALVVESIAADGTTNLLYVNGSMGGQYPTKASSRRFPGKIVGNKITATGNGVTVDYVLKSPTELTGSYTASFGKFGGSFKKQ